MLRKLLITTTRNGKELFAMRKFYKRQHAATAAGTAETNQTQNVAVAYVLQPAQIQEAIALKPTLSSVSPELWQRTHDTFANHGIDTQSFLQIVCGNPAILTRHPKKIIDSFENWRSCQFGEKLLHLLLTKYPELFDVRDGHQLVTHIAFLKSYVGTSKNVWKLLMNSPDLMEQTEQRIDQKINYITQIMRIEIPEIVKSAALSTSMEQLRCRHVLLERLGLFKPRALKADPNEPTQNHRLYKITDTSEKTFATKICHVSLEEFEAFQALFEREQTKQRRSKMTTYAAGEEEEDEEDDEEDDDDEEKDVEPVFYKADK